MALFYGNNNTVLTIAGGSGTNNLVYNYGPVTKISGWVGLGTSIFGNNLGNGANGIAYARNRWITVGQGNNTIAYSDNGISWTPTGLALFVYGNGDSIIGLNLWTDPDATGFPQNFTILSGLGGSFTADQLVTYLNSVAIVGIYGVSFSWDPIAYRFSVTNNQGWYIEISFTDSQLGFFALSFPPYTQTVVAPNAPSPAVPPIFTTAGTGVSASPTQWIATGLGTNSLAYSTNGIDWTGIGTSIFTQANACEWNPSNARWVVVGSKTPTSTIAYSADGVNWTSVVSDPFDTGRCVATAILAGGSTRWVAGGEGSNTLAYSNDGITWTGSGASILSNGCFGVAWNGKLWVAVGSSLSGEQVATSTNGISWISRGAIPGFFTVNAVCWNGSFWVVAGEGGIAYSTDGINWTSSSISIDFPSTVASRFSVL